MSTKVFHVDSEQFETEVGKDAVKILRDDSQYLVVKSVLASEIVQPYRDNKTGKIFYAYKSADELEKAVYTFDGVPIKAFEHPAGSHINNYEDVNGRVKNPSFHKDLMDPKTKRPCRRGIVGDLYFFRAEAPEVKQGPFKAVDDKTAQAIRDGTLRDNSIGFECINDPSSGEYQGQHYDVVQRNIFGNHLAAPIERGRCPSPYCGIGMVDSGFVEVEKDFADKMQINKDCPVCAEIGKLGVSKAVERLNKAYGSADILLTLQDAKTPEELEAERLAREEEEKKNKKTPEDAITKNKQAIAALDSIIDLF